MPRYARKAIGLTFRVKNLSLWRRDLAFGITSITPNFITFKTTHDTHGWLLPKCCLYIFATDRQNLNISNVRISTSKRISVESRRPHWAGGLFVFQQCLTQHMFIIHAWYTWLTIAKALLIYLMYTRPTKSRYFQCPHNISTSTEALSVVKVITVSRWSCILITMATKPNSIHIGRSKEKLSANGVSIFKISTEYA